MYGTIKGNTIYQSISDRIRHPIMSMQHDPLIRTLQQVYTDHTGEQAELLAIGGGTYARVLEKGVAFGMLFPGREDVAHQADEYVYIDDLVKATAIYADAISRLACEKTEGE